MFFNPFSMIMDWLWLIALIAAYVLAIIFIWGRFGKTAALGFASIGLLPIIYFFGRNMGKKDEIDHAKDIEGKRQKEYDKIDQRDLTKSDVAKRLRDKSY